MGEIGRKFRQHMLARGYSEATRESYEQAVVALVRAYGGASPDQLSCDQVQAFVANLVGEKKRAWNTVNVYVSAFRCFYQDVLGRKQDQFSLPPRGRGRIRPRVLDRETVRRILEAHTNLKHRALLEMTYGAGLRVSEVCRLKACHIESAADRMTPHAKTRCASHLSAQTGRAGGAMHPCGEMARFGSSHGPFGTNQVRLLSLFASTPSRSRPLFRRARTKRGIQTP